MLVIFLGAGLLECICGAKWWDIGAGYCSLYFGTFGRVNVEVVGGMRKKWACLSQHLLVLMKRICPFQSNMTSNVAKLYLLLTTFHISKFPT